MLRSYYYQEGHGVTCGLSTERMREVLRAGQGLLWVDIEGPEDVEIELLLETFQLHPLTVEDCIMTNVRPKLEEFEGYLFVVVQGLRQTDGTGLMAVELDLCVGKHFLVTVHSGPMKSINDTAARVEKRSPIITRGADFLCHAIVDTLINNYLPILESVERQGDEVESKLLGEFTQGDLRELFGVYRQLMVLRRTLTPHREVLSQLNRGDVAFIEPSNTVYFRDIYDHLLRMSDLVDSEREVATMLLEAHATVASNRLNEMMKTMTAFATLALQLVIVTGIFGMNFGENPELGPRWIYQSAALVCMGAIPVMFLFFRRSRWL